MSNNHISKNSIHNLARAVIIHQNRILFCRTRHLEKNIYFLPGGHIENSETAEEAVLREILEETSCRGKIKRFLGCIEYLFEPEHQSICHNHEYNFIFEIDLAELPHKEIINQSHDDIELVWISLNQPDKLKLIDAKPDGLINILTTWLESPTHKTLININSRDLS